MAVLQGAVAAARLFGTQEPEKAQQERVSLFRVARLITGTAQYLCIVRSISAGELTAEVESGPAPGERVTIELGGVRQAGTVAAVDGPIATVSLEEPVGVQEWLQRAGGEERRTPPRVDIECGVRLQLGDQAIFATARDISQEGIRVESDCLLLEGDEVAISLPGWGGTIRGSVRWADAVCAGIRFHQPLQLQRLAAWVATANGRRRSFDANMIRSMARQ